jgi:hypothetical protein
MAVEFMNIGADFTRRFQRAKKSPGFFARGSSADFR